MRQNIRQTDFRDILFNKIAFVPNFETEQGGLVGLVTNSCFEGVLWLLQISNSLKKCRGAI